MVISRTQIKTQSSQRTCFKCSWCSVATAYNYNWAIRYTDKYKSTHWPFIAYSGWGSKCLQGKDREWGSWCVKHVRGIWWRSPKYANYSWGRGREIINFPCLKERKLKSTLLEFPSIKPYTESDLLTERTSKSICSDRMGLESKLSKKIDIQIYSWRKAGYKTNKIKAHYLTIDKHLNFVAQWTHYTVLETAYQPSILRYKPTN